ncbi:hypothetical protein EHM76_01670, partial [bacterium]
MDLTLVLLFSMIAGLAGLLGSSRWRIWLLLAASLASLFWMQPSTPVRNLSAILPAASLCLVVVVWAAARPEGPGSKAILIGLLSTVLIALFVVLKSAPLSAAASAGLRRVTGQPSGLASALDIRWLGYSYLAFRLLHVLRDRRVGRLASLPLAEFLVYALFFPAFTSGPIDRFQRFQQDLRRPFKLEREELFEAGRRILAGVFKKFALADSLALVALNGETAAQASSPVWLWVMVYAYALRLYFDFSGYTDIAIGLGRLSGICLPENFERPYLKPNLTLFWNSWHITLAQWFRAYFFNPLTRTLRSGSRRLPPAVIVLVGQLATMTLIGLWHGVTWNFAAWGAWHA